MFKKISRTVIGLAAVSLACFVVVGTVVVAENANRGGRRAKTKSERKRKDTGITSPIIYAPIPFTPTTAQQPSGAKADSRTVTTTVKPASSSSAGVHINGGRFLNLKTPRELFTSFDSTTSDRPSSSSQVTKALSLATGDLNLDGAPDLLTGYAAGSGGVVSFTAGNVDAFAPSDEATFRAIQAGKMPPSFVGESTAIAIPGAPDFLLSGDFNSDGLPDIVTAARGTGSLYFLAGNGAAVFAAPVRVKVSGAITSVTTGTFGQNGGNTIVVAVDGPSGAEALVFATRTGGLLRTPTRFTLPAAAQSITFGDMDKDSGPDVALAAGREVVIIHGPMESSERELNDSRRVEQIDLPFEARAITLGYFLENREQRKTIAVLASDGGIYLLQPRDINMSPYSAAELAAQSSIGDQEVARVMENWDARPLPAEWSRDNAAGWQVGNKLGVTGAPDAPATTQAALMSSFISYQGTSDLFVVNSARNRVEVVQHPGNAETANAAEQSMRLDLPSQPTALVEMTRQVNGQRDLVMLQSDSVTPLIVVSAPAFTVTVDRTDDVAAASACTGSANDCSLRGAVTFANTHAGGVQINMPANTYNITLSGGEDSNATGDLDLLGASSSPTTGLSSGVAFVGVGAPTTIIQVQAGLNERVFQVSPGAATPSVGWTGSWSGITMQGGGSTGVLSGGAILMGGTDNIYTIASCTFNNNTLGGNIASNGGAISQSAKSSGGCGQLTVTNATFTNNSTATGIGGGIRNLGGTTTPGTEFTNITGGTFDNNQATTNAGGGVAHTLQAGTSNYNKIQFTNNKAYTTGAPTTDNGGGGISKSNGTLNVTFCRFRNNAAGTGAMPGSGKGVQLGGNGDIVATNDWWGCNVDPQSAGAGAAGCDTAFKVASVTGTLTTLPQLVLKNTANPNPIVTGQDTTLTASINTNSANQDVSASVIALLDLPVAWSNAVRGNLSAQQLVLSNITRTITTATEAANTVTITTSVAHGFANGQTVLIAGVSDSRYTGVYTITGVTSTTFTYTHPISGLPAASGGTAKVSTGTATANFRASAAGAGSADATVESAVATANFTINKADTTSTITSDTPDPTVTGQPVTVNFSLSVNAPGSNSPTVPTGNVTITADTGETCTGSINAATPATGTCNITIFHAGNRTLTAVYNGDANFNISPASSPATAHVVNKADTTIVINSDNPDPSVTGQSVTVAYTVSVTAPGSAGGTFNSGTVAVTIDGNPFCSATVVAAQCSAAPQTAGPHTFVATYQGDANYNASPPSTGASHTVNKADTTTTITNSGALGTATVVGQPYAVNWSVTVNAPGAVGAALTGNVTVSDGSQTCVAAVSAGTCNLTSTTPGAPKTITATYAGDTNYNASPASSGVSHTVNKANTTAAILTDLPDPSVTGQSVTITYSVSVTAPGAGTPTGNVDIKDGATIICTGTVAAAQCTGAMNVTGARNLTATYNGDTNFNASPASPTAAHQVNKADTTASIISALADPSVTGETVTVTFSVAVTAPGGGTPTGNVTIKDGATTFCTGTVAAGNCSAAFTSAGAKTLTATYAGDTNYNASPASSGFGHTVNQASTTATITNDTPDPSTPGQLVTVNYTVAVTAPGAGTPTGNVQVTDGVDSCTGTVAAGSCQVALTTLGSRTLTATYQGDANFSASPASAGAPHFVGTIPLIISELRTNGTGGPGDDFVELYNNSNSSLTVGASDASAGFGLYKRGADCNAAAVLIATIPNGTVIPARGHYLVVGSAYSLADYGGTGAAAGNVTMSSDIEDDRNVGLFSTANVANITLVNRLDAVGFGTNTGNVCDLLREGNNLGAVNALNLQYSFFRSLIVGGNPKDTNDNSADFLFADTMGTLVAGVGQRLGAPGPENLTSPIRRDTGGILLPLLDGTMTSSVAPNRFRDATPAGGNAPQGTLEIRRRVQNTTGAMVTRLRFRIVDMTTGGPTPPAGTADLRVLTSSAVVISGINDPATCASTGTPATVPCQVTAQVTTLETPPSQAAGGGYNSTVSVSIPGGLANNASIDVNFRLGVMQLGTFRFKLIIEALP